MKEELMPHDDAVNTARRLLCNICANDFEMRVGVRFADDKELKRQLRELKSLCAMLIKSINKKQ